MLLTGLSYCYYVQRPYIHSSRWDWERTPEPSATLAGVIATERASIFSTPTNSKENMPTLSSRSSGKTWKPYCFELLAHNTEPQMVGGETILPAPSDIVIISGKTDSAAPLASRISRSKVASNYSTHENALPFSSVNCKGRSNYRSYRWMRHQDTN